MNENKEFSIPSDSIPRCVQFSSRPDAIAYAHSLVDFLWLASEAMVDAAGTLSDAADWKLGMERTYALLHDMLDIGTGQSKLFLDKEGANHE